MKKYSELSWEQQCKICKDTLRPLAGQIFGHLYEAELNRGNQWLDANDTLKRIASKSVLAASHICSELNKYYGSQNDELYEEENNSFTQKLFTVTYCYGQEVYSANSAEELLVHLNKYQWHGPVDLSDIQEVTFKKGINFIGGHVE